jgi:hypothetical protein
MNHSLDFWLQRITVGALLLLTAALLMMGVAFYAPPSSSSLTLNEVRR